MFIKTKRFAYDILKEYYDYCEKTETISYFNGCTTVLGARKVGKTILLKQLCEVEPSKSYYMDCTDMPETFDFESFYEECLSKGVSRVFLDEVCKIPDDIIADFIESTKLYSAKILITITGSVKLSVSKLSSRIGRGRTIELPPISYTEQIGWEGVSSNIQNSDIRHYLSLKTSLNLNELVISCSDKTEISSDYSFIRNDILLTALDKAYFKRCYNDFLGDLCGLYCNKSVLELIARQS
jgi:predicted AAA+ superfamily ATPase